MSRRATKLDHLFQNRPRDVLKRELPVANEEGVGGEGTTDADSAEDSAKAEKKLKTTNDKEESIEITTIRFEPSPKSKTEDSNDDDNLAYFEDKKKDTTPHEFVPVVPPPWIPGVSATSAIPCKFGVHCNKGALCKFSHVAPPSSRFVVKQATIPCKFGVRCKRVGCPYEHPNANAGVESSVRPCKFGVRCAKANCPFFHGEDSTANGGDGNAEQEEELSVTLPTTPPEMRRQVNKDST